MLEPNVLGPTTVFLVMRDRGWLVPKAGSMAESREPTVCPAPASEPDVHRFVKSFQGTRRFEKTGREVARRAWGWVTLACLSQSHHVLSPCYSVPCTLRSRSWRYSRFEVTAVLKEEVGFHL